jgi:hypothetical protein
MPKQPPNVNGVMQLDDAVMLEIKTKLVAIQDAFIETDEQPVCDTFYMTAAYNRDNPDFCINGDTTEFILASDIPTPVVEGDLNAIES